MNNGLCVSCNQLVFDYDDQMKIPFIKDFINDLTEESVKLRYFN